MAKLRLLKVFMGVALLSMSMAWANAPVDEQEVFPFSFSATVSNSIGIGTFLRGYGRSPSLTTSLFVAPSYVTPKLFLDKVLVLTAEIGGALDWMDSFQTVGRVRSRQQLLSDLSLEMKMPEALGIETIDLYFSPFIQAFAPTSLFSRAERRIIGGAIGFRSTWAPGDFSVSWTPSLSSWAYSSSTKSIDCGPVANPYNPEARVLPAIVNPHNPDFSIANYMVGLTTTQYQNEGQCFLTGRQTLGTLKNSIFASWSPGRHSMEIGLGWYLSLLRPLADFSGFRPAASITSGFSEASMGKVAYSYAIPFAVDLTVSMGILSVQGAYAANGNVRFPFFDLISPGNNNTQMFVDVVLNM